MRTTKWYGIAGSHARRCLALLARWSLVALLAGLVALPARALAAGTPQGTLSQTSIDFGNVRVGDATGPLEVTMTNTGDTTLTMSDLVESNPDLTLIFTNCIGGHSGAPIPTQLAPSGTCFFRLYLVPATPGPQLDFLHIVDDAPDGGPVLRITGFGTLGYYLVRSDGFVSNLGDANFFGDTSKTPLSAPIVGMATVPNGEGYWLLGRDGGVFSYGEATFHGSTGSERLNQPVVSLAATRTGAGYWFVASDGGIFAFGDAGFLGSMGGTRLNKPVVAMAVTADGGGYWLVASDGGIFAFGDAQFFGSMGGTPLNKPIVGITGTPDGEGYWLVASDGGVFAFGDAAPHGSLGSIALSAPVVGLAAMPDGGGYWMAGSDGAVYSFGNAPFLGNDVGGNDVVGIAATAPPLF